MLNAAAKKGIDIDATFNEVHRANMDKKDQLTGKFLRREDGKIIKPTGWKQPCIDKVLFPLLGEDIIDPNYSPVDANSSFQDINNIQLVMEQTTEFEFAKKKGYQINYIIIQV